MQRWNWEASQHHNWLGRHSHQSGQGALGPGAGLGLLPVRNPVDRAAPGGSAVEAAGGPALDPPPHPGPVDLQSAAGPPQRQRAADQSKQGGLGGPVDARGDRAVHPQRDFPRSTASSTACSTTVAWSLSTSHAKPPPPTPPPATCGPGLAATTAKPQ